MTANNNASDIGPKLKGLIDYIRDCQTRVTRGEIMDLQGLDKNVIDLCDEVAKLPEKSRQGVEKQMTVLIESLETLAETMREQQGDEDEE